MPTKPVLCGGASTTVNPVCRPSWNNGILVGAADGLAPPPVDCEADMYGTTTQRGAGTPEGFKRGSWSRHGDHQHGVQFYSQDSFLLEALSEYVGNALRAGDAAVVVATETHRNSLLQWLTSQGLDIATLVEQERLVVTDAAQLLETFMRDGWPNQELFVEVVGGVVGKALAGAAGASPRVAVFGEMVALLWAEGKADAAIRLEQLWNQLGHTKSFSL